MPLHEKDSVRDSLADDIYASADWPPTRKSSMRHDSPYLTNRDSTRNRPANRVIGGTYGVARFRHAVLAHLIVCGVLGAIQPPQARASDLETRFYKQLAARIEPDLVGRPERLRIYVDFFQREMVNDPRLFAYRVAAKSIAEPHSVVLTGHIELPETHRALLQFLACLGFDRVTDEIADLPSAELGGRQFGFIKTRHSFSYNQPDGSQEVVTDCVLGEPLYLLRGTDSGYLLCHSGDGYIGYVRSRDVVRVTAAAFADYQGGTQVRMLRDARVSDVTLPLGARLKCIAIQDDSARLQLPTGETVVVADSACQPLDRGAAERVQQVIGVAEQLLKTPYLWGGKTSTGIDCSGLVQTAFAAAGLNLPRDSSQQVYLGRLTGTRWQRRTMRAGDTLYFVGQHGKIRHTALYVGGGKYIEAAGGAVRISSLRSGDGKFDRKRSGAFVFAKRLLD